MEVTPFTRPFLNIFRRRGWSTTLCVCMGGGGVGGTAEDLQIGDLYRIASACTL